MRSSDVTPRAWLWCLVLPSACPPEDTVPGGIIQHLNTLHNTHQILPFSSASQEIFGHYLSRSDTTQTRYKLTPKTRDIIALPRITQRIISIEKNIYFYNWERSEKWMILTVLSVFARIPLKVTTFPWRCDVVILLASLVCRISCPRAEVLRAVLSAGLLLKDHSRRFVPTILWYLVWSSCSKPVMRHVMWRRLAAMWVKAYQLAVY
jgi:hypothetical protein